MDRSQLFELRRLWHESFRLFGKRFWCALGLCMERHYRVDPANSSDLSGCPSGPCTATLSGGVLSGWLKALSADNNGWDGWISLRGTSPAYGVSQASSCSFAGDAWGSDVVGWVDFSYAHTTTTASDVYTCQNTTTILDTHTDASCNVTTHTISCPTNAFCVSGSATCLYPQPQPTQNGTLAVNPDLITKGHTVIVSWNITGVQSCTVTGSNGDSWSGLTSGSTGKTSSAIQQQTIYTLSCVPFDPSAPAFIETATVNFAPTYREQ